MYNDKIEREQRQRYADTAVIMGALGEFLDSYILIGYDLTGASVKYVQATTQKDKDGLSTLMSEFINEKLNGDADLGENI